MPLVAWAIFVAAAVLEVAGDALARKGLRSHAAGWLLVGFCLLGCYGIVVNLVRWDFSKLLGVYVAVFATVSILAGQLLFREKIPVTTWTGLAIIVAGGMVIQFGSAH